MSIVSTIVLFVDYDADDKFRHYVETHAGNSLSSPVELVEVDSDMAGGWKVPEVDAFWAAVNHLYIDDFFDYLDRYPNDLTTGVAVVVHTGTPTNDFRFWKRVPPEDRW